MSNQKTMSEQKWTAKSRGNPLGYRIFIFFLKHFGLRFAYANLLYVAPYFIPFAPQATKAVWYYYRRILHYGVPKSMWSVYLHYFRFGQCLIDKMAIQHGLKDKFRYTFDNYEAFLDVLNAGKGAVLIGAHVGAWQMSASFFGNYGRKMHVVLVDKEYEQLKKYVDFRERAFHVIPINKTDVLDTMLTIKKALNAGEYICLQGDRYTNDEHTLEADFMGRAADFPEGPFLLASRLRVPVVFFYSLRENGGYTFKFVIVETGGTRCDKHDLLAQYVNSLEQVVRAHPQMWFNFYQFWK